MAKTILEALNELVEKQGGNTEDNKLIVDALNDLVESGGGSSGGAGYEKTETKVFWVDEQTITVTNTAEEGQDPNYTVSEYTNNEDVLNGLEVGTEGTCVIDGAEYKAVWSQDYVGYVRKYIAVYDGETEILKLGLSGWIDNEGFFTAEGTHTISVYYMKTEIIPSEDFKTAVSKVVNLRYIGSGQINRINETSDDVSANATYYGSINLTAETSNYNLLNDVYLQGNEMNFDEVNAIRVCGCIGRLFLPADTSIQFLGSTDLDLTACSVVAWNLTGGTVTASELNSSLGFEIELYKIEE